MRELNVVISGFDHYDGVEVNPAVEVPKAIAEQGLASPLLRTIRWSRSPSPFMLSASR